MYIFIEREKELSSVLLLLLVFIVIIIIITVLLLLLWLVLLLSLLLLSCLMLLLLWLLVLLMISIIIIISSSSSSLLILVDIIITCYYYSVIITITSMFNVSISIHTSNYGTTRSKPARLRHMPDVIMCERLAEYCWKWYCLKPRIRWKRPLVSFTHIPVIWGPW